jgi:hypothetical protein
VRAPFRRINWSDRIVQVAAHSPVNVGDDEPPVGVVVEDPSPDVGVVVDDPPDEGVVVEPPDVNNEVAPAGIAGPESAHQSPVHRHQLLSPPRA